MAEERIVAFDDDEMHDDDETAVAVEEKPHVVALVGWTLVLVFVVPYLLKYVPVWVEWARHRMFLQRASQTALEIVKCKLEAAAREAETQPASPADADDRKQQESKESTEAEAKAREAFSLEASVMKSRQQAAAAAASSRASNSVQPAEKRPESGVRKQAEQEKRTPKERAQQPIAERAVRKVSEPSLSTAAPRSPARFAAPAPISRPPIEDDFELVRREQDAEFERSVQEDLAKRQAEAARQAELEKLAATKAAMRESLVPEPGESDENAITLGMRIGTDPKQRFVRRFLKQHTLGDVANFVYSHPLLDGVPIEQVKICFGYQSKPVLPSAFSQSLEQFGIASNSVVIAWVDRSVSA